MNDRPLVLVVDDNEDTVEMLSEYLTRNGCRVLTAQDGNEAIRIAESERPAVVLLDLAMPGVSGHDVARRLRAGGAPDLCLVATTGLATATDRRRAVESGFDHFIAKPYDLAKIAAFVHDPTTRL